MQSFHKKTQHSTQTANLNSAVLFSIKCNDAQANELECAPKMEPTGQGGRWTSSNADTPRQRQFEPMIRHSGIDFDPNGQTAFWSTQQTMNNGCFLLSCTELFELMDDGRCVLL